MAKKSKKWKLYIGCHKGTSVSKESQLREHNSLEDCKCDVNESEEFWGNMGYFVWFAKAVGPDGKVVSLHKGTPYC